MHDVRTELERIIRERGEDYSSLSRLLGRNAAYIQQFISRGTPRKLAEDDRRTLARYLGVDEALLGGPAGGASAGAGARDADDIVVVPRFAVGASAGPGAHAGSEEQTGSIGFDQRWLRRLGANPRGLSMIMVQGESMAPTLNDGDDILVDRTDAADRMRDGIYVLRVDDALIVKRLAVNPATRSYRIRSDNPAWPDWADCDPAQVQILGRVVWAGRKLR
ncbi:MAG TPA: S24 family peptidase [Chakrabartia sp.]|jgi:SOS-response transcriptional repressor LexA|nr:S24 family peptidase [Chakrabartia sp.]